MLIGLGLGPSFISATGGSGYNGSLADGRRGDLFLDFTKDQLWTGQTPPWVPFADGRYANLAARAGTDELWLGDGDMTGTVTGLAAALTVTRASTKYGRNASGVWTSFSSSTLCYDYHPTYGKCASIEEARTNSIRNNSMQGGVAGTPGTVPTNWAITTPVSNLNREIVGFGTEDGIDYIDVRYSGTTNATNGITIAAEPSTGIAATLGQTWTASFFCTLVGGSTANISSVRVEIAERDSGGSALVSGLQSFTPTAGALRLARQTLTYTTANASVAFVVPRISTGNLTNAAPVDITLRIGWPQMELGAHASSPIRTTTVAVTRAADVPRLALNSNLQNLAAYTLMATGIPATPTTYGTAQVAASLDDSSVNNRLQARREATTGAYGAASVAGGVTALNNVTSGTWAVDTLGRIIMSSVASDQVGYREGGTQMGTATGSHPATINSMTVGARADGAQQFNGWIRDITVWGIDVANATQAGLVT